MIRFRSCAAAAVALHVSVSVASAQNDVGLRDQMTNLFEQSVVLSRTAGGTGLVAHTPTFEDQAVSTAVTGLLDQISNQIGLQVAGFPLGSSSSGFTYVYDSALGSFSRSTDTFGPAFAERAMTAGKGKASFGMIYLHSN